MIDLVTAIFMFGFANAIHRKEMKTSSKIKDCALTFLLLVILGIIWIVPGAVIARFWYQPDRKGYEVQTITTTFGPNNLNIFSYKYFSDKTTAQQYASANKGEMHDIWVYE